jgi:hypothetical protein
MVVGESERAGSFDEKRGCDAGVGRVTTAMINGPRQNNQVNNIKD